MEIVFLITLGVLFISIPVGLFGFALFGVPLMLSEAVSSFLSGSREDRLGLLLLFLFVPGCCYACTLFNP